ncbi:MAG TPA: metalloregulator ArsR/SmtB family transcription factor [Povalibacter sp.]|uniref:ArsR/SmtB family transcription factor n=1 Tax=Povalibacter sp. TaxID=1962978 RepID=UPI002CBB8A18|nr:metalloregulator ArsR/SmtB family transcription factor [Povalibacter sp.]HMN44043.1 metalloregulator ArsR/SmtB family transcription factor [Povalibacter sp.]
MPRRPEAKLHAAAPVFAALGDATRLRLVARLCSGGPASIAALTANVDVTRQAVTKHLHVLQDAGLVRGLRQGREQMWEIEPAKLDEARQCLDIISAHWDAAIERLRAAVEE